MEFRIQEKFAGIESSHSSALLASFNEAKKRYLWQELETIREATLGSQALIAHIANGAPPEALSEAFTGQAAVASACIIVNAYVSEIAMGDVILREKQELLPAPASPDEDIATAFKNSPPDWKALWQYVDASCTNGTLSTEPSWSDDFSETGQTWRQRLEAMLAWLNETYVIGFAEPISRLLEQSDAILKSASAEVIEKALAAVKPLALPSPAPDPEVLLSRSSPSYVEELRARGSSFIAVLGKHAREHGNTLFKSAASMTGAEQKKTCSNAITHYVVATYSNEESATSWCNAAAVWLFLRDYATARKYAEAAIEAGDRYGNDRPTYACKRSAIMLSLVKGCIYRTPLPLRPRMTDAQRTSRGVVTYKSHLRLARAYSGLCRKSIKDGSNEAQSELNEAQRAYKEAHELDPSDESPATESKALLAEYLAAYRKA